MKTCEHGRIENGEEVCPLCLEQPELKEHCQNGRADICLAGAMDGVCCPEHECDIDSGMRKL